MAGPFKKRDVVFDLWWPGRIGQVLSCSPNFCRVRYPETIIRYDKPHMKFLRRLETKRTYDIHTLQEKS